MASDIAMPTIWQRLAALPPDLRIVVRERAWSAILQHRHDVHRDFLPWGPDDVSDADALLADAISVAEVRTVPIPTTHLAVDAQHAEG